MIVVYDRYPVNDFILKDLNVQSFLNIMRKGIDIKEANQELGRNLGTTVFMTSSGKTQVDHNFQGAIVYLSSTFFERPKDLKIMLDKLELSPKSLCWIDQNKKIIALGLKNEELKNFKNSSQEYYSCLSQDIESANSVKESIHLQADGFWDLSTQDGLVGYLHADFQLRHFNGLEVCEDYLKKSSRNLEKIKGEYSFFHLAPERSKPFLTPTFDYEERNGIASYKVERYRFLDSSVQWIHNSFDSKELGFFLNKILVFFKGREEMPVSKEDRKRTFDKFYIQKVQQRFEDLKILPMFEDIDSFLRKKTSGLGLVELYDSYFTLINDCRERICQLNSSLAFTHGDLCLSNILYNKEFRIMKFIDPKGAIESSDLMGDPFYDLAKLSHSILGDYDYINNMMANVEIGEDLTPALSILKKKSRSSVVKCIPKLC